LIGENHSNLNLKTKELGEKIRNDAVLIVKAWIRENYPNNMKETIYIVHEDLTYKRKEKKRKIHTYIHT